MWQPETVYLNTATYGLPPAPAWEALQAALEDWRGGRTSFEAWTETTAVARTEFATLVGAQPTGVAVGATVSGLVGTIAASLPRGARVLGVEDEFTSLIFPFMAAGAETTLVALDRLADAVDARTDVVAVSAVQSASGAVAPLAEIAAAARTHGARLVVDGTQACGWLPLAAGDFDALVCGAYKWLMSPRGTAFMAVGEALAERLVPFQAGWFAGEDVYGTYYGGPLRLAPDARRFDTSPAWFSWVGTAPALRVVNELGIESIHEHDVRLANRFRAGLGLPPGDSAIVSADVPDAQERLARAGIQAAARAGRLRASFHVYNSDADVDAALAALA
ncbi:MAG TPA: aminotransferase class V-fold PLP-dependent enzyme [Solirubrobacteraceae bacterium]